jgi:hypothetical protein
VIQERIDRQERKALFFYDSLAELAKWLEDKPATWSSRSSEKEGRGMSWDLAAGYPRAWEMARYGWLEGAEKAQEALRAFVPQTPAPINRTDFYGHMPHVPRYCAGAPDNMIRHAPNPRDGMGKVLTLIVPVNATSDVRAQSMSNFGLGVAQYVNQLETEGVRVEVIGILVNSYGSRWHSSHAWRIKGADQPLDLAVMAFAIGHPAMFRRIGFALLERGPMPTCPSYGCSIDATLGDVINCPNGAVILNGMTRANTHASTPEKALEYITKQIEAAIKDREETK